MLETSRRCCRASLAIWLKFQIRRGLPQVNSKKINKLMRCRRAAEIVQTASRVPLRRLLLHRLLLRRLLLPQLLLLQPLGTFQLRELHPQKAAKEQKVRPPHTTTHRPN